MYEGRAFPADFKNGALGGYGEGPQFTEQGAVAFVNAISPFEFLKGLFVDKPARDQAAAVELARQQAQVIGTDTLERQKTFRTVATIGAGLAGLMLVGLMLRRPASARVSGYRRSRRSRRK